MTDAAGGGEDGDTAPAGDDDAVGDAGPAGEDDDAIAELADVDWPLLRLLGTSGRPHLHWFGLGTVGAVIASVLDRADVFVIGLAIDAMFNDRAYALPLVPDAWIPTDPVAQLWFTVGILAAMKLTDIVAAAVGNLGAGVFSQRVLHAVRVEAFDTAQRLELGFFDEHRTGEVMSVLNNDVNTLEEFLQRGALFLVRVGVSFATALALMLVLNWQLAVFVVLSVPVVAVVNRWFARVRERRQDRVRSETGRLNARIETDLGGIDVVKAFTAEPYEGERLEDASDEHRAARWSARRIGAGHPPSMRVISGTVLVLTFVVGSVWVVRGAPLFFTGELTAGQLVPFLFYTQTLTGPLRWLARLIGWFKQSTAAAKRIHGLRAADRHLTDGDRELADLEGHVAFDDVDFAYPGSEELVLDGVDVEIRPGETVGIVGSTGAGKSTLVKLLLRYYDVRDPSGGDAGAVRVDGTDVRDVTRESLRGEIGYVPQDPFLFDAPVRENVAYGARGTGVDADGLADDGSVHPAVERAVRDAGAEPFVESLPDGYDTEVGERGVRLSGGQRQRLAIARAVVGDPSILVFDEATSHVDNETEVLIQEHLDELTVDVTTLVVAHRLSTVRDADRILVLEDGRVVEAGTHEDLLERDGTYADLWRVQVGEVAALPDEFVAGVRGAAEDD